MTPSKRFKKVAESQVHKEASYEALMSLMYNAMHGGLILLFLRAVLGLKTGIANILFTVCPISSKFKL